jgi:hypothetical protein
VTVTEQHPQSLRLLAGAFATLTSSQTISGDKAFSGNLTAVTQAGTDNSTKVATTAYVTSKLGNLTNVVNTFNARTGNVTLTSSDVTTALTYTPLATANSSGTDTLFSTYNGISYSLPAELRELQPGNRYRPKQYLEALEYQQGSIQTIPMRQSLKLFQPRFQ